MSGSECYGALKTNFKDCWDEINSLVADGQVEIYPGHIVPVEMFLGGDYKFLLIVSARSAANSNHACLWCKIHKNNRWDMSKSLDTYNKGPIALTLAEVKERAKTREYGCVETPLMNIPLDHIILDELHLLLRITDVLLANLIEDAMEWDDTDDFVKKKGQPKGVHLRKLTQAISSCGVTFSVWEKKDGNGKGCGNMDWTSLMGDEKKKVLRVLPGKLESENDAIHPETAMTVIQLWKDFADIYFTGISSLNPGQEINCGSRIRHWIEDFLTLANIRKGYANKNVTPYMHAAAYHIQGAMEKFKNVKQFSGQGVEKNNDTARSIVLRKSNNWDSPAAILQAEHRMTHLCKRERKKRGYQKHNNQFWVEGKQELMRKKRRSCISVQHDTNPQASNSSDSGSSSVPNNGSKQNKRQPTTAGKRRRKPKTKRK